MSASCDQEMCPNWSGDGAVCPCAVFGIERPSPAARCVREGGTPDGDELIVDCREHGEIGTVPAQWVEVGDGLSEYERMEALFADHVASITR